MIGTPGARRLHPLVDSPAKKVSARNRAPSDSTVEHSNHRGGRPPHLMTVAASLIIVAGIYLARDVLIPFTLAVLVSFLLGPFVGRLHRWGLPRVLAVISTVLLVFAISGVVAWVVTGELRDLAAQLPAYRENIRHNTAALRDYFAKPVQQAQLTVKSLGADLSPPTDAKTSAPESPAVHIAEPAHGPVQALRDFVDPALGSVTLAAMVLLFTFVMLLRPEDLRDRLIRLVGDGQIYVTTQALDEASRKVSGYLARQLLINGVLGTAVGLGLMFIGIPSPVLWGVLFALLRFIPYVGPWLACAFPFLLSLAIFDVWTPVLETVGLLATLELVGNTILEPWLYGTGTGISPLAILVSTLFWSWLWGPMGLILATPMTVCLVVMGKYVPQLHFLHLLCSDSPALSPATRLYQRLIAQDPDGAWSILKTELSQRSLHHVHDSLVLPALSIAEHDRQRGALGEDDARRFSGNIQDLLEESEDARLSPASDDATPATPPAAIDVRILCIPARGEADALAAGMLARRAATEGATVEVTPLAEFLGETVENVSQAPVDIVFISAVAPSRFTHVRYICKKLAIQFPDLEIVICLWTLDSGTSGADDRIPTGDHVHLVTSLDAALGKLRQLAGQVRILREHRATPCFSSR
jgi:predicted PurR-regulated permease PerM